MVGMRMAAAGLAVAVLLIGCGEPEPEPEPAEMTRFEMLFTASFVTQDEAVQNSLCEQWRYDSEAFAILWEMEGGADIDGMDDYTRADLHGVMARLCN